MISSHPQWASDKEAPVQGNWLQQWLKSRFRFVDYPFLITYRGMGNEQTCYIQGHVFRGMALRKPRDHTSLWENALSMLKLFMVRTVKGARVALHFQGETYTTNTNAQGFFEFQVEGEHFLKGWQPYELRLLDKVVEGQEAVQVQADALIAYDFEYGLISDIDDTFLVSHVTNKLRKLHTLLTNDSASRQPVEGVVQFYQALCDGVTPRSNPFFYVSSSEWNLYEFLVKFTQSHELPKGVFQLKELKDQFVDFFRSGYGSHDHKRDKIERILRLYPQRVFILLGDNGQHDPRIYAEVTQRFPQQIKAVYIRGVKQAHWSKTEAQLASIRDQSIPTLQFKHSQEALVHAQEQGFIVSEPMG